jgi:hypothetical protein
MHSESDSLEAYSVVGYSVCMHVCIGSFLVGLTQERHRCTYACAIPWPPSAHSRFKLHLISLMYMNLMTERADMPCIVACQFQSLIWVETRQIFTKSQILLLTAMQKLPPVMQSINIHSPCCKDGGGMLYVWRLAQGSLGKLAACSLVAGRDVRTYVTWTAQSKQHKNYKSCLIMLDVFKLLQAPRLIKPSRMCQRRMKAARRVREK